MPFEKGKVANPLGAGAAREKRVTRALLIDLLASEYKESGRSAAEELARASIHEAIENRNPVLMKQLLEYAFGKPDQNVNLSTTEKVDLTDIVERLGGEEKARNVLASLHA